jgi:hypothetical protein
VRVAAGFDNLPLSSLLLTLCSSGSDSLRERAAFPAPAAGLCMTGVGYDLEDLSKSKFLPTNPKTIARNKRKKEEKERLLRESTTNSLPEMVVVEGVASIGEELSSKEEEK